MLIHVCKPEFQFKKSSTNVKFGQCLYLVAHLCCEQNRCAERTVTPIDLDNTGSRKSRIEWHQVKPAEMTNLEYQDGGQSAFSIDK